MNLNFFTFINYLNLINYCCISCGSFFLLKAKNFIIINVMGTPTIAANANTISLFHPSILKNINTNIFCIIKLGIYEIQNFIYFMNAISSLNTNVLFNKYEMVIAVIYPNTKEILTPKNIE